MLESFVINICVPTAGTDRYPEVAINQYPVVVLGREYDLHNALRSDTVRDFIKHHILKKSLYKDAKFYIRHLLRDNTDERMVIPVPEMVVIPDEDWSE